MGPNQASLLHIRGPLAAVAPTLGRWLCRELGVSELPVEEARNGWVTLPMELGYTETYEWLRLAADVDFLYESYCRSGEVGELVCCLDQELVRHVRFDEEKPDAAIDRGRLPSEAEAPLASWSDVWEHAEDWKWIRNIEPSETGTPLDGPFADPAAPGRYGFFEDELVREIPAEELRAQIRAPRRRPNPRYRVKRWFEFWVSQEREYWTISQEYIDKLTAFLEKYDQGGCTIHEYTSSQESWASLAGRAGYVLLRDGRTIDYIITMES